MKSFFKVAINSIKTSGTIKPSSRHLIKSCLKDIDFTRAQTIVEFGTGNGCITQQLAHQMSTQSHLFSFEINPDFHAYSQNRFASYDNIDILRMSALDFDQVLKQEAIEHADYIISSLPLTLFKDTEAQLLLNKVRRHLKPDGVFVQYQYNLSRYKLLKRNFNRVQLDFTVRNVPPAFVYTSSHN